MKAGRASMNLPRVTLLLIRLRMSNFSIIPTRPMYRSEIPALTPAHTDLRRTSRSVTSDLLLFAGAHDPARPEDQHQDQDGERDDVGELIGRWDMDALQQEERGDRLQHPQEQAAQGRAGD